MADKITPTAKKYEKDQYIVRKGDRANGIFYFLQKGLALADIDGETVGEIKTGEFFGEMAALLNGTRTANVIASTTCEVIEFQGLNDGALFALMTSNPKAAKKILETLAKRVAEMNARHAEELAKLRTESDQMTKGVLGTVAALEKIVEKFQSKVMGEVLEHLKTKTGVLKGDEVHLDRNFFKNAAKAFE